MFKKSLQSLFCILSQFAFYSQSAVSILHSVCILPLVRSPQSTFYTDRLNIFTLLSSMVYTITNLRYSYDTIF